MAARAGSIEIKDGVASTNPADFPRAVEAVRRDKLSGIWIRPDFEDKKPKAPVVDLSLLRDVPNLEDFGIANIEPKRIANFEAIYDLGKLKKLSLHAFKTLELARFPKVETLFLTDGPGATGLEALAGLRYARVSKLRAEDLSFVAKMRHLSELWLVQAASKRLSGLDASPSLATLTLSHCAKLEKIDALPKSLVKLKIEKCGRLRDLAFVAKHPSLDFLYVDVLPDVAFVPGLRHLTYLGFQNVIDGDLRPLVESKSLRDVAFYPAKRKNYTHSESELKQILAARKA